MITNDPRDPRLKETDASGMQKAYLVLSDEERAKGFVRPYRESYKHVGARPKFETRDLTPEEQERYKDYGYVKFEGYPADYPFPGTSVRGRFWTKEQLESGCCTVTTMGRKIAETYARDPEFYGATFCCGCGKHLPVGEMGEFEWLDGSKVGT